MESGRYIEKNLRFILNFLILSNIVMLIFYCILRNPIENSMSMIGNRYTTLNLLYFISWGVFFAGSTYYILINLYEVTMFKNNLSMITLRFACIILIITTLIPAKLEMPILRGVHIGFSILHVLLFAVSLHPFISSLVKGRKLVNTLIIIWMVLIWPGSVMLLLVVGWNAVYQFSYFINVLLLLMYLSNHVLNNLNKDV